MNPIEKLVEEINSKTVELQISKNDLRVKMDEDIKFYHKQFVDKMLNEHLMYKTKSDNIFSTNKPDIYCEINCDILTINIYNKEDTDEYDDYKDMISFKYDFNSVLTFTDIYAEVYHVRENVTPEKFYKYVEECFNVAIRTLVYRQ